MIAVMLSACGQDKNANEVMSASDESVRSLPAPTADVALAKMVGGAEESLTEVSEPKAVITTLKRYIAMRHSLMIETSSRKMQAAFDETVSRCEQLNCQILSANFNRQTPYSAPSASLSVRVPPRSVEIFLTGLAKNGDVLQHHRDTEDKTDAVIDADARIKNLIEFRDSLRAMLGDKSAKFKDLIEVQRELVNTQSQLDSINGIRKSLAQETEMVAVNIDFSAEQSIAEQSFFAPVIQALDNAGRIMMESIAAIITFLMTILPWLVFGIPMIILARKIWHKIRSKKV
ncbi:MAG: DUF4349 domain-containing protein [Methylotenera sp.]|nr:DUF4349 domain-containing protein [Methylotenera sp.]